MEVEVRTFVLNSAGAFEAETIRPLSWHGGECPQVGDTICHNSGMGPLCYLVERRFFFDLPDARGWALIVKRYENLPIALQVAEAWKADDVLWAEVHANDPDDGDDEDDENVTIMEDTPTSTDTGIQQILAERQAAKARTKASRARRGR
jgi:hypothetical protein